MGASGYGGRGEERAYVSVLQWRDGSNEVEHVEALVASCALDPYDAQQRVRRGVPQVICRASPAEARVMLEEFARRGVLAFAPTRGEIAGLGSPARVKRLMPMHEGGGYVCEMWQGEGAAFRFSDVFCMVRAKIRSSRTTTSVEVDRDAERGGYLVGGIPGAMMAGAMSSHVSRQTQTSVTDMLDLHLRDGGRLRLDSTKFSFDVLGDQRAMGDHLNMELLCDRLRREMPRALFDRGFDAFVCPVEFLSDRVRGMGDVTIRTRSDAGPFEFYSPWACLMYRHLLAG